MRILILILLSSSPLCASDDPLLARLSQPMKPGSFEFNIGLAQYTRDRWMNAEGWPAWYQGEYTGIVDSDGIPKSVKGFRFDFRTLWQAGKSSLLELSIPYYYQELSKDVSGNFVAAPLDDWTVRRGDGVGDLNLVWRQVLLGSSAGSLGANLECSLPTGQGPFAAAHSLITTGTGAFGGALALQLEGHHGDWGGWLQGRMPFDLGANATIGNEAFVGYQPGSTTPRFLPSGPAFVRRDPGMEADLGLAWTWEESETYRHRLVIEVNAKNQGALVIGDARIMETAQQSIVVVPQASFSYASSISLTVGWLCHPLWAANQAISGWGELLIRADYRL
jgi:hypothetical protein